MTSGWLREQVVGVVLQMGSFIVITSGTPRAARVTTSAWTHARCHRRGLNGVQSEGK
jgi:hypothetical protein